MMSFLIWLFSQRKERERSEPKNRRAAILHDAVLFALIFALAILISSGLSRLFDDNNQFSVPVFILAVSLIARFTQGYIWGVAASGLGVFCVNYMFTYPYWQFDMSIAGYPLTFTAMLIVSLSISTLTSRVKRQEQLRLEMEMEKMRANLLRSVSHDLRTPLTSIVGASSVLLEDGNLPSAQRAELLHEINRSARWLARITENILSVTRFSGGGVHLRTEYEVVEEIVGGAIVKFRKGHPALAIAVQKPEKILLAPMDATLIEQVILNLLDNAVVHGKTTSRIRIAIAEEGDWLRVSVSDDGAGIPEGAFPHLFDGQLSGRSGDHRNMGIGLSVCQSIIHAHGGRIAAKNNPAGGALFEFWLPAKEDAEHELAEE